MGTHGTGLLIRLGFLLGLLHYSTPSVVGKFGLLTSIEAVSIYFAGMEFHTFTARRYMKAVTPRRLRILMRAHLYLVAITAPATAAIGACATIFLKMELPATIILIFAIALLMGAILQEMGRYLILNKRPVSSIVLSMLRTAAWQPAALLLILAGKEPVLAIVGSWTSMVIAAAMWSIWTMRHQLHARSRFRLSYIRSGLWKARTYYGISALSTLQGNLERFVLQFFLGPASVGVFSYFQTLANTMPSLVQAAILNLSLPHLLAKFGQRDPDRWAYRSRVARQCLLAAAGVCVVICALAVPLTTVVSKHDYQSNLWMLPILLLGQMLLVWTQVSHLALYASHRDSALFGFAVLALAASAVLNLSLVPLLGIAGATVAPLLVACLIAWARQRTLRTLESEEPT
jgi:O-antigen/teichoic acid export membrane protein